VFRVFDKESLGVISPIQLKVIANGKVEDETMGDILSVADPERDGDINYLNLLTFLLGEEKPSILLRSKHTR